jgi:CheY-like chemotaxis protein
VSVPAALPPALADPSRVRQILTNLLTNAHLYTPEGGRLEMSVAAEDGWLRLEVSDTGQGMTPEELERVWERFYRGSEGAATPGTGLGLSIVRSLVELHGGAVDVRSAPGEGTTFTVRLPQAPASAERAAAPRLALRGKRVLIVDDEPDIAELIATHLRPFEVESVMVHTGEDALERLREERFDAVTLDILMPGISGFEVLQAIRADPEMRRTPLVVVSVFSGREALAGEMVVAKPIDADELVDALGSAVIAGRTRVLVVGRAEMRERLVPGLERLGIEHDWVESGPEAARLCEERRFEVALVDAGLRNPQAVLEALDLRGRRVRRAVVVFSAGEEAPGLARLAARPVRVEDAAAAVLEAIGEPMQQPAGVDEP